MTVRGREDSYVKAERLRFSRLFFGVQLFRTARTTTAAVGRQKGMVGKALFRRILPSVNVDRTRCQALQVYLRLVLRVEGRKAVVTRRAMEEHHVAEYALSIKHACQEVAAELAVEFRCPPKCVGTVGTEAEIELVWRSPCRGNEVRVRVLGRDRPSHLSLLSIEDHFLTVVLDMDRLVSVLFDVSRESALASWVVS